jgi:hypothetical protein
MNAACRANGIAVRLRDSGRAPDRAVAEQAVLDLVEFEVPDG